MKIKQKGIATAAIAVVVIVIIAVAGVGAFLVLRGRAPAGVGGLPVYGGATKSDTLGTMGSASNFIKTMSGSTADLPSDVTAEAYTATGSVSDVLSYYRTEMANAGWTKKYDNAFDYSYPGIGSMSIGFLYFEKADRAAAVVAVSYTYQGETYIYFALVEGPKAVFEQWMGGAGYEWEEEVPGGGETPGGVIGSATSLDFKYEISSGGVVQMTYRYRTRNIGTANMDLRVDVITAEGTVGYILSGSQQEGWINYGTQWVSFSSLYMDFSDYWSDYSGDFSTYTDYLSDWTSGEWSETYAGITYRIYDIQVNPTLSDSVFQPS